VSVNAATKTADRKVFKIMIEPGDVISYLEMCTQERVNLQRGMNFRLRGGISVILMSVRKGAPYEDKVEDEGRVLIYEGHDVPKRDSQPDPKNVDQPYLTPRGTLTQNGLFYDAAKRYKTGQNPSELVRVYEKIRQGIWVYNGIFKLTDAWKEVRNNRKVFKFKLEIAELSRENSTIRGGIDRSRVIPTAVKLEVWKRDRGKCVICGSKTDLHFDHIIPYSRGGSSLVSENIQILCVKCNIAKKNNIV